jgi:hypothetical protein
MTQPIFFFAEINLKHPWIAGGKLTIDEKYLGIMSGETHIEARLFNALGYAIYQDSHVCKLFIYEDFAHSKPTVDNCKSVEQFDKIVTREIKKVDLHWYSIELTHTEIHCQTSVIQQVPTYYTIQDGTLLISSDMHDMMHKKGDILTLNYSHLATLLLRNW